MKTPYFHPWEGEKDIAKANLRHESKLVERDVDQRIRRLVNKDKELARYIACYCKVEWQFDRWMFQRVEPVKAREDHYGMRDPCISNLAKASDVHYIRERYLQMAEGDTEFVETEWVDINRILLELREQKVIVGMPIYEDTSAFFKQLDVEKPKFYRRPKCRGKEVKGPTATEQAKTEPTYPEDQEVDDDAIQSCLKELESCDWITHKHPLFSYWLRCRVGGLMGRPAYNNYTKSWVKSEDIQRIGLYQGRWYAQIDIDLITPAPGNMPGIKPGEDDIETRGATFANTIVTNKQYRYGFSRQSDCRLVSYFSPDVKLIPNPSCYLTMILPLGEITEELRFRDPYYNTYAHVQDIDSLLKLTPFRVRKVEDPKERHRGICAIAGFSMDLKRGETQVLKLLDPTQKPMSKADREDAAALRQQALLKKLW